MEFGRIRDGRLPGGRVVDAGREARGQGPRLAGRLEVFRQAGRLSRMFAMPRWSTRPAIRRRPTIQVNGFARYTTAPGMPARATVSDIVPELTSAALAPTGPSDTGRRSMPFAASPYSAQKR